MSDLIAAFSLGFLSALGMVALFVLIHSRLAPDSRETEIFTKEMPDGTKHYQVKTEFQRKIERPDNLRALKVLQDAGLVPREEYEEE